MSSYPYIDMSAYTDSTIQVCFYLASRTDRYGYASVGPGWYIDDVELGYAVPTPTLLTRFDAKVTDEGIQLEWQFDQPERLIATTVERAPETVGPWAVLPLTPQRSGSLTTALDRSAATDQNNLYRLNVELADGSRATFGPISVASVLAVKVSGLNGVAPNPAPGNARIDFAMAREDNVRISVVDVAGRQAAVLANGKMAAGTYSMIWDGRKDGTRVPAGVYFVRWESAGRTMNRRLVLVK